MKKSLLHYLPAEFAHECALAVLALGLVPRSVHHASLGWRLLGAPMPSPIMLAAGADKNGRAIKGFAKLGFGALELGTVTPQPQSGNKRPRVFRLPQDAGIINRIGIANKGAQALARRMGAARHSLEIMMGVNVGAGSLALARNAPDAIITDYKDAITAVLAHADWITLNVSCPNVPTASSLAGNAALIGMALKHGCGKRKNGGVPLWIKLSPDDDDAALKKLAADAWRWGVDGVILANTARQRAHGLKSRHRHEAGGVSGKPLAGRAMHLLRLLHQEMPQLPIISCGGIASARDVLERLVAGAAAVQLYTALVYGGVRLITRIHHDMVRIIKSAGVQNLPAYVALRRKEAG